MNEKVRRMAIRLTPVGLGALALAAALTAHSEPAPAQNAPINALSQQFQRQGEAASSAGRWDDAANAFESALIADPRNASAFVGLARVASAQNLPGKAIGFYREALKLRPGDRSIVAAQGEALLARGALDRARANLVELRRLCANAACPEADTLSRSVTAAGARTAARTPAPTPAAPPAPTQN